MLDAYCHFAVIYHRSPVGLPMPKVLAGMKVVGLDGKEKSPSCRGAAATPAVVPATPIPEGQGKSARRDKEKLNRLLQEIAWDTVESPPPHRRARP